MRRSTNPKQTAFNDSAPNPSVLICQREENFKSSKTEPVTHKENVERHLRLGCGVRNAGCGVDTLNKR